jgi:uncharacterized protein YjiS (DUF1127 family)
MLHMQQANCLRLKRKSCAGALRSLHGSISLASVVQLQQTSNLSGVGDGQRRTETMGRAMTTGTTGLLGQLFRPQSPASLLRWGREALERRRVYRRTLRELRALSRRDLDDLGICPEMITRLALEAAHGRTEYAAPVKIGVQKR